jgi:hypothetical protein
MAKIPGRLRVELHPNGTVRMVFIPSIGGGNETLLTASNLETAEIYFINTCGLTPVRAAAVRAELKRNKIANVDTAIEDTVGAKFR